MLLQWIKNICKKRRLVSAIKFHVHMSHALHVDYDHHNIYRVGLMPNGWYENRVAAELRCANRLRHLLVKLKMKRI